MFMLLRIFRIKTNEINVTLNKYILYVRYKSAYTRLWPLMYIYCPKHIYIVLQQQEGLHIWNTKH